MAAQGSYPMNGRTLAATDTLTGVVTGATADVPVSALAPVVAGLITIPVTSVFGRTGAVVSQSGDYSVAQVTGAAPLASPTFTGTVTLPSGTTLTTPNITGVTTNSNAAAGSVGEYISATVTGVGVTSGTPANITSISLTPGDWDVSGTIGATSTGASMTLNLGGSSATSATTGPFGSYFQATFALAAGSTIIEAIPTQRYSLTTTTTIYAVYLAGFTGGTVAATAILRARRVR